MVIIMPYINVKVTEKLSCEKQTELKCTLGKAIEAIPGKTETYLMVCIEDDQKIWFAGDDSKPSAFVDVRILGHAKPEDFSRMTDELCSVLQTLVGVAPSRVYVTYAEVENWGWNGRNF